MTLPLTPEPVCRSAVVLCPRCKGQKYICGDCELVWTNFDKPARIFDHLWSGLLRAGEENVAVSSKLHPHQKPVSVLRKIIAYSGTAGVVLDPYCGSGSTLVAARDLGLPSIGIEIEERYCEIAASRLSQKMLFAGRSS